MFIVGIVVGIALLLFVEVMILLYEEENASRFGQKDKKRK